MEPDDPSLVTVHYWPDWSAGNPVQSIMYADLASVGARASGVREPLATWLARCAGDPRGMVLHVHWTGPVVQSAPSPIDALRALRRTVAALADFVDGGGRLVWTVHNVLPHDARYRWAEMDLAQWLADHADLVHVMSRSTEADVRPYYTLDPARVVQVDLSGYEGVYPHDVTREEARRRLGLAPGDTVLVALGGIRPYKGLHDLVDAFTTLAGTAPDLRLLLAGRPSGEGVEELRRRCADDPRIVAQLSYVDDAELQVWLGAADLAVLPYRQILNSAAFTLCHTFGLPVVGPRMGALLEWEDSTDHVRLFDPGQPESLVEVLRSAIADLVHDPVGATRAREAALEASARLRPGRMAQEVAQALAPVVRGAAQDS